MSEEEDRWQRWLAGLRRGDREVLHEFWGRYGQLLHDVADRHLAPNLRRRVGPEDVAQSACRTFLRRARDGEFRLQDSEDLWRLLCAITLTKVREQTRFHLRQKRGLAQEVHADAAGGGEPSAFGAVAPGPTPAEAAEFADQLQKVIATLDDEEKQILDLKLQDFTHVEVAERLGCSERTVRRVVKKLQARLARAFEEP
jgi:RNA polymerase sigma factor (sigma-70 family)